MSQPSRNRRSRYRLAGRMDAVRASQVEQELFGIALDTLSSAVILDCSDLTHIDPEGLRMLVQLGRLTEKRIELVNLSPSLCELVEAAGFREALGITPAPAEVAPSG